MFNKIVGSAAIITASYLIGKSMTNRLKNREESLIAFHNALIMLESEINFSANSIDRAFKNISEAVKLPDFFEYVISEEKNIGIRKAWSNAVALFKDKLYLTDNDAKILKTLSGELGITDKENQIKNIQHVLSMLSVAETEAHEKRISLSGLYRNISMSAGLVTVILMI